ncbi:MAG: 8-amino-7-oxononanoate synthase [Proteobacteria bacterium]|nr:8-amino-7-oxononanoate synthase [Pseudomonadota bacterium]MBU4011305.1 8-amino-7-oxononanoate synthase [Pseudomonadota bacterium]MBU4036302.1 8-amino-7-oxononanoate synthase [Pseudomonadota bacterium]
MSESLNDIKAKGLFRKLRVLDNSVSTRVKINNRTVVLFSSNDYLGLANDLRMKEASAKAVLSWGTGSGASRLISGNTTLYTKLEEAVARFKKSESALVFPSGYSANAGVISSLAQEGDLILSDALNHASIIDACKLTKAKVVTYPHCDVDFVKDYLDNSQKPKKVLVVTDGVFSMTGELAPIPQLCKICKQYGALLMVDDAHGTGVTGPEGRGTLDYYNLNEPGIVQVGTFSKALGGLGGFVAGSNLLIDFIINHARSIIYSTALPPSVLASNCEGIRIISEDSSLRIKLFELINQLRDGLVSLGFPVFPVPMPIIPIVIGDVSETLSVAQYLWDKGFFVPPIRPPTVMPGESCLRISLSALNTTEDIDRLLWAIKAYYKKGS